MSGIHFLGKYSSDDADCQIFMRVAVDCETQGSSEFRLTSVLLWQQLVLNTLVEVEEGSSGTFAILG